MDILLNNGQDQITREHECIIRKNLDPQFQILGDEYPGLLHAEFKDLAIRVVLKYNQILIIITEKWDIICENDSIQAITNAVHELIHHISTKISLPLRVTSEIPIIETEEQRQLQRRWKEKGILEKKIEEQSRKIEELERKQKEIEQLHTNSSKPKIEIIIGIVIGAAIAFVTYAISYLPQPPKP